jgi:hypothetical protein
MTFVPDAIVGHAHELEFRQFWQQQYNYGRGAHHYHLTRANRGGRPLRIEPWPFYSGLLRFPFRSGPRRPLRLAALLFIARLPTHWVSLLSDGQAFLTALVHQAQLSPVVRAVDNRQKLIESPEYSLYAGGAAASIGAAPPGIMTSWPGSRTSRNDFCK